MNNQERYARSDKIFKGIPPVCDPRSEIPDVNHPDFAALCRPPIYFKARYSSLEAERAASLEVLRNIEIRNANHLNTDVLIDIPDLVTNYETSPTNQTNNTCETNQTYDSDNTSETSETNVCIKKTQSTYSFFKKTIKDLTIKLYERFYIF